VTERNLIYEQAYLTGFKDLIASRRRRGHAANDRVTARRLMALVNSLVAPRLRAVVPDDVDGLRHRDVQTAVDRRRHQAAQLVDVVGLRYRRWGSAVQPFGAKYASRGRSNRAGADR
jgi:hypothetical protein